MTANSPNLQPPSTGLLIDRQAGTPNFTQSLALVVGGEKMFPIVTHLPRMFASVLGAVEDLNTSFSVAGEHPALILKNNYLAIFPVSFVYYQL